MRNAREADLERAQVRLTALMEARDAAFALDRADGQDPYLWGYGAGKVVEMLNDLVRKAEAEVKRLQP